MPETEVAQKGREMRRELMGAAFVDRINDTLYSDPIMQKFVEVTSQTVFGSLWTRPGLDLKTRTLICVVSDAATGHTPELPTHIRMAMRQGWTEDELVEVMLQLTGYVGAPAIREALLLSKEIFAEIRAEH
jgi:4-carboxymuconolactone decarboxylase